MAPPLKLDEFNSSLNTILGLLVAVLVILMLSAVLRFIYFCRRGNAMPTTVKCDFKEHLEKLQEAEADYLARISKRAKKLSKSTRSQSKSSKKSSRKETRLSRNPSLMVDLEKGSRSGVYEGQLAEMKMRLDELVAGDTIDCLEPEIKVVPDPVIVPLQLPVVSTAPPPMPSQPVVMPTPQPIAAAAPTIPITLLAPVQKPIYPAQQTNDAPVFRARDATSPLCATAKENPLASVALGPTAATPSISLAPTQQRVKRVTAV